MRKNSQYAIRNTQYAVRCTRYAVRSTQYFKGVTLIELIVVMMVVGILTAASSMYIKETVDLWRFLNFRSEVVSQGRMALMKKSLKS